MCARGRLRERPRRRRARRRRLPRRPRGRVALVDPRLLDRRDDLADGRPDLPRVVAVQRVARPDEHRVRAAAERLRGRHRRVDPERARHVVRRRDDAAAVWVAADDQGNRSQRRVFQLLDRGEERIQVEMSDNHAGRVEMRVAVLGFGVMVLVAAGCGSERAQPVAAKPAPAARCAEAEADARRCAAEARRAACSATTERVLTSARTLVRRLRAERRRRLPDARRRGGRALRPRERQRLPDLLRRARQARRQGLPRALVSRPAADPPERRRSAGCARRRSSCSRSTSGSRSTSRGGELKLFRAGQRVLRPPSPWARRRRRRRSAATTSTSASSRRTRAARTGRARSASPRSRPSSPAGRRAGRSRSTARTSPGRSAMRSRTAVSGFRTTRSCASSRSSRRGRR